MTTREYKRIAQMAVNNHFGFLPKQRDIEIVKAEKEGCHIEFKVKDVLYDFESRAIVRGCVAIGSSKLKRGLKK